MPDNRSGTRRFFGAYGLLLAAIIMECVVFEVLARYNGRTSFLSLNSLINILNQSATYGVLAVGMTLVILTGGIDLSVGSLIAFGGVIAALFMRGATEHLLFWMILGWLCAFIAGGCSGFVSGMLITRVDVPPFIATLALMSTLRGFGYMLAHGQPISPLPPMYTLLGRYRIGDVFPACVVVMLLVFILGGILLNATRFGRYIRAIGGNEETARLSGIPVHRVKCLVYCLSGLLSVLGGLIVSSRLGSGDPKSGLGDELSVIAAVVVGGTSLNGGQGTITGTFIGLLIISILNSGLNWIGAESFTQQVTLGLVILSAVLLDRFKRGKRFLFK